MKTISRRSALGLLASAAAATAAAPTRVSWKKGAPSVVVVEGLSGRKELTVHVRLTAAGEVEIAVPAGTQVLKMSPAEGGLEVLFATDGSPKPLRLEVPAAGWRPAT